MTRYGINSAYFMHSTPEYNRKHKEENSKYNHKYYEEHKEKWQDNDDSDSDDEKSSDSKSGSDKDDKDKKKSGSGGKSGKSREERIKEMLSKLNGGGKKGGSSGKKKSSSKSSKSSSKTSDSKSKKKETEEEKEKREAEEKAEAEREAEEEKKKTAALANSIKEHLISDAKMIEEQKKKKKTVKHSACYVGINSQPYFQHHGRLGMKWGKRNGPPYPLDYSKLSEEERAKDKTRVKEEGDIESVAYKKNRSYFTDQEINEVINRYQLNTRINQLSADSAKMKAGKSKSEELAEKMAKVADVGNKLANGLQAGSNVYNNVAKIMNAFGDADLPIIGQQKPEKKKEFKATKKELDKLIENLETGMGKMTNQEMQDALKRKTMYDSLVKDRDSKRASEAATKLEAEAAKNAEARERNERIVKEWNDINSGYHNEGKSFWEKRKNDDIEHVTGEVVDSGEDFANRIFLLEDKRRR